MDSLTPRAGGRPSPARAHLKRRPARSRGDPHRMVTASTKAHTATPRRITSPMTRRNVRNPSIVRPSWTSHARGAHVEAARAEHPEEELQESGGDLRLVRQRLPRGGIAAEWGVGRGDVVVHLHRHGRRGHRRGRGGSGGGGRLGRCEGHRVGAGGGRAQGEAFADAAGARDPLRPVVASPVAFAARVGRVVIPAGGDLGHRAVLL